MLKNRLISLIFFSLLSLACSASAKNFSTDWDTWVQELRAEVLANGIKPAIFDSAFRGVQPSKRVQHFDRTQPEKRLTYKEYRNSRIDAYKIKLGRKDLMQYQTLLNEIQTDFHVNECIVTALWGMESSYGRYKGSFPVVASLATLSFQGRRTRFFRQELLFALQILNEGHVSLQDFKGEWAGASGHPQFLPSSWFKYAVDYDGDNKKDIWNSVDDALASIANYLKMNGWHPNEPWAYEVSLPGNFDQRLLDEERPRVVAEWFDMGVTLPKKIPLNLKARIIIAEGGPPLMTFHNFKVIKKYNNSTFYAGSVGYLADMICS